MNNPWIQTFTGKIVYPFNPDYGQISIVDIAHSLSMKCRFNGHSREFYSVAQHCIEVSKISEDPLFGLLHDASEAYIGDIASPIKKSLSCIVGRDDKTFAVFSIDKAEQRILEIILSKYTGHNWYWDDVEDSFLNFKADKILLSTEYRDLIPNHSKSWGELSKPLDEKLSFMAPGLAFIRYLETFDKLTSSKFINEYKGYL